MTKNLYMSRRLDDFLAIGASEDTRGYSVRLPLTAFKEKITK